MRTTIITALAALILAGSAAGAIACPQAHHPHALATWTEHNPGQLPERIYGYADGATPGSTNFVYGALTSSPDGPLVPGRGA
jgi:hypothetical protein